MLSKARGPMLPHCTCTTPEFFLGGFSFRGMKVWGLGIWVFLGGV